MSFTKMIQKSFRRWLGGSCKPINNRDKKAKCAVELLEDRVTPTALGGSWTDLAASGGPTRTGMSAMLLSDGRIAIQQEVANGAPTSGWFALSPDTNGNINSYINGSFSTLDGMDVSRRFATTALLPDGRIFIVGGEYSTPFDFTNAVEIYDPVTDLWTSKAPVPTPNTQVGSNPPPTARSQFGDDPIQVLAPDAAHPQGQILAGYFNGATTYRYDVATDTWTTTAGAKLRGDSSDEETWVKLPDGSILSYDIFASISSGVFQAQRYVPSSDMWVDASNTSGTVPLLSDGPPAASGAFPSPGNLEGAELGPAFMMTNGKAIFFGGNGNTAIYDPATDTWTAGPTQPTRPNSAAITGATNVQGTVTTASNGTPIVITTTSTTGLNPGDLVTVSGVTGNANANGNFLAANVTPTTFQLTDLQGNNIVGSGSGTGGTWFAGITITAANTTGLSNGQYVTIANVNGNSAANGSWTIFNLTGTTFQLVGPKPNGNFSASPSATWSTGQLVMSDAPGAVLPNGHILLAYSPMGGLAPGNGYSFPAPSFIYEFDPTDNTFTDVSPGIGGIVTGGHTLTPDAFQLNMLLLPTGQVLLGDESSTNIQVFTPNGGPDDSWRPVITNVAATATAGTYLLVGQRLNGLSEGATYGDDMEQSSNYPILQFTDAGGTFYAKTFNWSSVGVQTAGDTARQTVNFTLPSGHPLSGITNVTVIANGIPSKTVNLKGNDTLDSATVLGSDPKIIRYGEIDSEDDVDFYKYTAEDTGKVIANTFYSNVDGQTLEMRVWDADGNIIATGTLTSVTPGMDRVGVVIPVVAQKDYFIEVFSSDGNTNSYSLEIENIPAPIPNLVDLDPSTDTGTNDTDNNTFGDPTNANRNAHIYIQADLGDFAAEGITIIADPTVAANRVNGAAVEVLVNGVSVGFATPISGTDNTLYEFNLTPDQLNDRFPITPPAGPARGWLNQVTAAVRIFDNRGDAEGDPAPASGRTQLSVPLQLTFDPTAPVAPTAPDLLASSDSAGCPGTTDTDNITNVSSPTFAGTGEMNTIVRIYATKVVGGNPVGGALLVGQGKVGSDNTDGVTGNGIGAWAVTVGPLTDGVYNITATLEDLAGNISPASTALQITIDTEPPQRPTLDLADISDSGRNNKDNITNNLNTTLPGFLRFRVTSDPGTWVIIKDGNTVIDGPFLMPAAGFVFRDIAAAQFPTDRDYLLSAEASDLACNISAQSEELIVEVDRTAPGAPTVNLHPNSDSGVSIDPPTLVDFVTNRTTPELFGTAEADAIIHVSASLSDASTSLGLTVAIPLDGNQAFPNGQWNLVSTRNLNDPNFFALDGTRDIRATAEDRAGNVSQQGQAFIFIDTQGPQVTNVQITGSPAFNLFGVKAGNLAQGPTPLVNSLTLSFRDLPDRDATNFPNHVALDALLAQASSYSIKGDLSGYITIQQIIVTNDPVVDGQPATATVQLIFAAPLPDDRFTLTISDHIADPAGNALDGESNAAEPQGAPTFPSGDGVPGGSFTARFTVDSRPEIGVYDHGQTRADINGNGVWDPLGVGDAANHDLAFIFGLYTDALFAGNLGTANDFDKLGAYGKDLVNGVNVFRFLLDLNGDGKFSEADGDLLVVPTRQINGLPVAGEFIDDPTNPAHPDQQIGLFDGTAWYLDTNGNNDIDFGDTVVVNGLRGFPIVGDFDGDGLVDLATYQPDNNIFQFDLQFNGFGQIDDTISVDGKVNAPAVAERPVAADINQDGITDIGLYLPQGLDAQHPVSANWYFLVSDRAVQRELAIGSADLLDHVFNQTPFTQDVAYSFGNGFELPIIGNFDPPVSGASPGEGDSTGGTGTVTPPANQAPTVATAASATAAVFTGSSTTLRVLGADDAGESSLSYTWSSTGPAAVAFSSNGDNGAKNTNVTFTASGTYKFTVTIRDAAGLTTTSQVSVTVTVPPPNKAPTVKTAAKATLATTGRTAALTVTGADDGGTTNLTYTWSARVKPAGAADPTFSANFTNAARSSTVTFYQAGTYTFDVVIRDKQGASVTSSVTVRVLQKTSAIYLTPGSASIGLGQTVQFRATAMDQFGVAMAVQPAIKWSKSGPGTLTSTGLYKASTSPGRITVTASAGTVKASAIVNVLTTL